MLQMVMQVSPASRITSYSISFQPSSERSTRTWPTGLAAIPRGGDAMQVCSRVNAVPPPVPPRVKAGRMMSGRPISSAKRVGVLDVAGHDAVGDRLADALEQLLEELAVFGRADRLDRRAQDLDVVAVQDAAIGQRDGEVEAGLATEAGEQGVGPFAVDDELEELDGERLDVGAVGDPGVGHDRGRVAS